MAGNLIIVSAPSGAGKTTLVEKMLARLSGVRPSVSMTARPPRPGEEDGRHYHFVTAAKFHEMIERGEFLEWAEVHGNLYGTSRKVVEDLRDSGIDVVLTIDVQGARVARKLFSDSKSIFILPPSRALLVERLVSRGTNDEHDLQLRLQNARRELEEYRYFDYVIINDDLERATEEMVAIIRARRCEREDRTSIAEAILNEFTYYKETHE
jgi:guanylate kinase